MHSERIIYTFYYQDIILLHAEKEVSETVDSNKARNATSEEKQLEPDTMNSNGDGGTESDGSGPANNTTTSDGFSIRRRPARVDCPNILSRRHT